MTQSNRFFRMMIPSDNKILKQYIVIEYSIEMAQSYEPQ